MSISTVVDARLLALFSRGKESGQHDTSVDGLLWSFNGGRCDLDLASEGANGKQATKRAAR